MSAQPSSAWDALKRSVGVVDAPPDVPSPPESSPPDFTESENGNDSPPNDERAADPQADQLSLLTEAVNHLLAKKDCPSEYRALIDYLIGISDGSTDWIEIADADLGLCVRPKKAEPEQCSRDAAKKYIYRQRKGLMAWQKKSNMAFIEFSAGGKDFQTNEIYASRYKINLLTLATKTIEEAKQYEGLWQRDRRSAIELAATEVVEDTPQTAALKPRFRAPRRDDEAILKRNPKTALTLLKQVRDILNKRGEDVAGFWEDFQAEAAAMMFGTTPEGPAPTGKISSAEARRMQAREGGVDKFVYTPPINHADAEGIDTDVYTPSVVYATDEEAWTTDAEEAVAEDAPPCAPQPDEAHGACVSGVEHAYQGIEIFESVAANSFQVTHFQDPSAQRKKEKRAYEVVDGVEFREKLDHFLELNRQNRWSMAVRPEGERELWLVDDASPETLQLLRDVDFAQIETSPGSYQSWIALGDELSDQEFGVARERFLRKIAQTGGNGGSYGALRWPGTFNCKPERKQPDGASPVVRIHRATPGRVVTIAELDRRGLLAPPKEPVKGPVKVTNFKAYGKTPQVWPSWERELSRSKLKKDGTGLDRSDADYRWCMLAFLWGWPESEVIARLREVSPKAHGETEHYIERTIKNAAKAAASGRAA